MSYKITIKKDARECYYPIKCDSLDSAIREVLLHVKNNIISDDFDNDGSSFSSLEEYEKKGKLSISKDSSRGILNTEKHHYEYLIENDNNTFVELKKE